ncbi:BatD family protein [Candidatus Methylocalor cossyra]|uniref:BatD family protein n=1 Tax=Candidatus Methylocalor cossyra TaxID=3108543 RepID=UPI0032B16BC0
MPRLPGQREGKRPGLGIVLAALGLVWLWALAGPAAAARIAVSLDRNPVPLNESFTLTFSADELPDGDPDFAPLERDFEILGQAQSNRFSLSNGRASRRVEWQLTVMARRAGQVEIPPIAFGADRSEPFAVTIVPAAGQPREAGEGEILVEVDAEPKNPYVQAQVIYTVRVLSRVPFGEARISSPQVENALIEKLDDGPSHAGLSTRHGTQYRVTELRYAVFPQKSGRLRIEPMRLEVQLGGSGRALFGPFFGRATRTQRLSSEAVELEVRPIPAAFAGRHWLPAEGLELEDSWVGQPLQITSGEPITRNLILKAKGATVGLLPELNSRALPPTGAIKQYPDQPVLNEEKRQDGLLASRQEKTAFIVAQPGTYRLPALEVPWWNTRTDRMEVARLPERLLTVLPSATHPPPAEAVPSASKASAPAEPPPAVASEAPPRPAGPWFWLALGLGAGWLATGLAWWFSRRSPPPHPAPAGTVSERSLVMAVERACRADDPLAARQALWAWAARQWPDSPTGGAEELKRLGDGELGRELERLDRALYGRDAQPWQGEALWLKFRAQVAAGAAGDTAAELEPLYKS